MAIHGPVTVEDCEVEECNVAVCLHGNHSAVIRGSRFLRPRAAAIVLHCELTVEPDTSVLLAPCIDESNVIETELGARRFEINVSVPGAMPMVFDEWPLPAGVHSTHVHVEAALKLR